MKEKLMYVNMLKEGYTVDYIKKHFDIVDDIKATSMTKFNGLL